MPLTQPEWRAIEIMIEQMERLQPRLDRALKERIANNYTGPTSADVVREFYDENTNMGRFELNYLNAIGKCLAPAAEYKDGIVTTVL